jgi:hypothetical protein
MKLDVNDKVRIMSGKTSTVVGTIKRVKQGLFRKKYMVIVKFKANNWLSGNAEVSYFWKTGEEIIEKLDKDHEELN